MCASHQIEPQSLAHGTGKKRLVELDAIRGLAAFTVLFSHYFVYWNRYLGDIWVIVPGDAGYYSVKLFFVISGFVIFLTLDKCRSVADFALLRFSRLYPAYWVTLTLATLVSVVIFNREFWPGGFIVNTTMFQQFLGFKNLDNVYWSLTVELAFYLNAAWLFALGLHKRHELTIAIWLLLAATWSIVGMDLSRANRDWLSILTAADYAPYFSIGILFYVTRNREWTRIEVGLIIAAVFVEFLIASWEGIAVAAASVAIFYGVTRGYLRILANQVGIWAGSISYALYLIHRNIGYEVLPLLHSYGLGPASGIAITTISIVIIAHVVTHWVERPISRLIRSRFIGESRTS